MMRVIACCTDGKIITLSFTETVYFDKKCTIALNNPLIIDSKSDLNCSVEFYVKNKKLLENK